MKANIMLSVCSSCLASVTLAQLYARAFSNHTGHVLATSGLTYTWSGYWSQNYFLSFRHYYLRIYDKDFTLDPGNINLIYLLKPVFIPTQLFPRDFTFKNILSCETDIGDVYA